MGEDAREVPVASGPYAGGYVYQSREVFSAYYGIWAESIRLMGRTWSYSNAPRGREGGGWFVFCYLISFRFCYIFRVLRLWRFPVLWIRVCVDDRKNLVFRDDSWTCYWVRAVRVWVVQVCVPPGLGYFLTSLYRDGVVVFDVFDSPIEGVV